MTTTPNDAAVNAESAAKLVSDEALELAKRCETMANFIWTEQNELTRAKRHECEDILCKAGKWIERHATPQTQATHGDQNLTTFGKRLQEFERNPSFDLVEANATHGEGEVVALIDIPAAGGLDPITVILRDFAPGHGQITVSCYGQAWTAYWGGMGDRDIRQFLLDCETGYIANKLSQKPRDFDYVARIVEAIKTHLSVNPAPSPTAAEFAKRFNAAKPAFGTPFALSGVAAQGDGETRVSDQMWQSACLAYERVTEYPYNRDAIRAAIVAALGVADQEPNIDLPRQG